MKTKNVGVLLGLVLFLGVFQAQAAFRDNRWGARPTSMGGAFTAVVDDADYLYWNPAGGAQIRFSEYSLMHAQLFPNLETVAGSLGSFSLARPLRGSATLGLGWTHLSASNLYQEDSVQVSYSNALHSSGPRNMENKSPRIFWGGNLKYLRNGFSLDSISSADPVFAQGRKRDTLSADLGFLGQWNRFSLGLSGLNVTEPSLGYTGEDRVPREIRTGVAYRGDVLFFQEATLAFDVVSRGGKSGICLGWENWFFDHQAALRTGWNEDSLSLGLGYRLPTPTSWEMGLDYAYLLQTRLADQGGGTHRLSLSVRWGKKVLKKEARVFSVKLVSYEKDAPDSSGKRHNELDLLPQMVRGEIVPSLEFHQKTSSMVIGSFLTMDYLIQVLNLHPLLKIRIVDGDDASLFRDRATGVLAYFMVRGISPERLLLKNPLLFSSKGND